ncbi:MAG: DinB family protein [Rhodothermales bacterium]|nr:DinB family protein [Rhodothermales bacterium]
MVALRDGRITGWVLASHNGFRAVVEHVEVASSAESPPGGGPGVLRDALLAVVNEAAERAHQQALRDASPPFDLAEAIALLARTPETFASLLSGVDEAAADRIAGGEAWCPKDVIGHLILGEKTDWMVRARHLLEHGEEKPFEPFHREAMRSEEPAPDLPALLAEFAELRRKNLADLKALELEGRLDAPGMHPALGRVTLGQLLATWTAHDLSHVAQLSRMMAARYRTAVGPWRDYLSVLDR